MHSCQKKRGKQRRRLKNIRSSDQDKDIFITLESENWFSSEVVTTLACHTKGFSLDIENPKRCSQRRAEDIP